MSAFAKGWLFVAGITLVVVAEIVASGAQAKQDSRVEVNPQPLPPGYFSGLIGLTSGQHARLSVVSLLPKPAPGEPPQNSGIVLLELISELGDVLSSQQDQIANASSTALDKSFEDLANNLPPGPAATRLEIRAVAFGIVDATTPRGPFRVSLEIYDADTGKTRIAHEQVIAFEQGDPDRPIVIGTIFNGPVRFLPGFIGLASGQRARLSVASLLPAPQPGALPGDPTAVELTFFSDQGVVIATSEVQVGVGESKFLDIGFDDAVRKIPPGPPTAPPPNRVEIRAALVRLPNPRLPAPNGFHPPNPCIPSLEIYDADTGKTTVAFMPDLDSNDH
jgi:hypothetical protein